jgi:hypothetical protein
MAFAMGAEVSLRCSRKKLSAICAQTPTAKISSRASNKPEH